MILHCSHCGSDFTVFTPDMDEVMFCVFCGSTSIVTEN